MRVVSAGEKLLANADRFIDFFTIKLVSEEFIVVLRDFHRSLYTSVITIATRLEL
jgi:hypothetical protein